MNASMVFALHFARLLSQLVRDPTDTATHRATVDDLLQSSAEPVTLLWEDWKLVVGGAVVPESMPGAHDVASRMAAHGLRAISFARAAEPAHVLGAASILAGQPVLGDGGAAAVAALVHIGTSRVHFVPVAGPSTETVSETTRPSRPSVALLLDDFEVYDYVATPSATMPAVPESPSPRPPAASPAPETPESLLAQLRAAPEMNAVIVTLEAIGVVVRDLVAAKRIADAAAIASDVIAIESMFPTAQAKRYFTISLRNMLGTAFFAAAAAELPRSREHRSRYMSIFIRFGDDAVDVLLDQLVYAEHARDRRVLFHAIVELGEGIPTLMRMLSDERWYVVRNAAELLGRLKAIDAQEPLVGLLRHPEARVRRSAARALAKLGSPRALSALGDAIRDPSPDVRLQAILAVAGPEPAIARTLVQAIDEEKNPDIQRAMYAALGRVATPEAVKRLIATAVDNGGLFRRTPTPIRVAAVKALAETHTPEAIATIKTLTSDRDRDVRESAAKGLSSTGTEGAPKDSANW